MRGRSPPAGGLLCSTRLRRGEILPNRPQRPGMVGRSPCVHETLTGCFEGTAWQRRMNVLPFGGPSSCSKRIPGCLSNEPNPHLAVIRLLIELDKGEGAHAWLGSVTIRHRRYGWARAAAMKQIEWDLLRSCDCREVVHRGQGEVGADGGRDAGCR